MSFDLRKVQLGEIREIEEKNAKVKFDPDVEIKKKSNYKSLNYGNIPYRVLKLYLSSV